MATIIIPTPLRKYTESESKVEIEAKDVQESIHQLTEKFPALKNHVLNDDGSIKQFVRIYVGDEDINVLEKEATKVDDKSTVSIIPAIAGGNHG